MLWQRPSNTCYDTGKNRGMCQHSSNCSKTSAHQDVMPFWANMFHGACPILLQTFQNTVYCSVLFLCKSGMHQFLEQVCFSFLLKGWHSHEKPFFNCKLQLLCKWNVESIIKCNLNLHLVVTITKLILKQENVLFPQESHSARFMLCVHTCYWWTCHRCSVALICSSWNKTKQNNFKKTQNTCLRSNEELKHIGGRGTHYIV